MTRTTKKNKKMSKGGRIALAVFAALLLSLGFLMGGAAINASIVRVRRAELVLLDLPASLDGIKILYASDIDLCGLNTASKSGKLFEQLQALSPDLLVLGGDYTSVSVFERLNAPDGMTSNAQRQFQSCSDFFQYISAFDAPLGKYAIASPEDGDMANLSQQMLECGVRPVFNDRISIGTSGQSLWLIGIGEDSSNMNAIGSSFSKGDCVIAVAYSPKILPILLTSEASGGGQWADLILCGHTHGGQIRLFGRNVLQLDSVEEHYRTGWAIESGLPILTTEGVGCEGANMRVGTAPEVWLITLKSS